MSSSSPVTITLQIFSRLDHDPNEINFDVINSFNGIEIKLDIKEQGTGYGLHLVLAAALILRGPVVIQKTQRVVIRPPNHLLSSEFLLLAAASHVWGFE